MTSPAPLPKYHRPPVIETALGVQFAPLNSFSVAHFGLFWATIRDEYPYQEMKPPLTNVVEDLGGPAIHQVGIQLVAEPEARCWFLSASRTELIQLQRDRFVRNWRKGPENEENYPSYDALKPRFVRDWNRLLEFLDGERLGKPQVNQCEVTYINHLAADVESLGRVDRFARAVSKLDGEFLPEPETAQLQVRYVMGDKRGRLHVGVQPGVRRRDRRPVLQLGLTARGTPESSELEDILAWLDLGHEWVVRGFTDFTRSEMHRTWERQQ